MILLLIHRLLWQIQYSIFNGISMVASLVNCQIFLQELNLIAADALLLSPDLKSYRRGLLATGEWALGQTT